jgi:hypothetical protein
LADLSEHDINGGIKMNRDDAIEYLLEKRKISREKYGKKELTDEQRIAKVMKEGKIYGDPLVILK